MLRQVLIRPKASLVRCYWGLIVIRSQTREQAERTQQTPTKEMGKNEAAAAVSACVPSSRDERHGVEGGEAGPHVRRGEPRPPDHAPVELLEPGQEERDPAARDDDERQRDEPHAQVHHQHLSPASPPLTADGSAKDFVSG